MRQYLSRRRSLDPDLLDRCRRRGLLGADNRANAVFACRDRDGGKTGAELVGTRPGRPFKGMAPGSRKALGGFWIARKKKTGPALLAESAVDALSALCLPELEHVRIVISTAGVATRLPPWIELLEPETPFCGYDADKAGDMAAQRLIESHPGIRRLRPREAKDWNECLRIAKARHRR